VDGEKYVAEEKFAVVHFDPQKIATQMTVYDLGGSVDVHVNPDDHATHAMEPGMIGPFTRTPAKSLKENTLKAMPTPTAPPPIAPA